MGLKGQLHNGLYQTLFSVSIKGRVHDDIPVNRTSNKLINECIFCHLFWH